MPIATRSVVPHSQSSLVGARRGYDGAQVCVMGLEGIVAKRRDSCYRSGRRREWIKVKNRVHPAFERAMLIALSKRGGSRLR
jgi:hypothetical protein